MKMKWPSFLRHHNLAHAMSRLGNCNDVAVTESFFSLLKCERKRRTRNEAHQDVFD